MKKDMEHIIIDTARSGSKYMNYRSARRSHKNPEDLTKESMRPKNQGWYGKDQRDRLSPMYRSIRRHEGKPWNGVYSDICSNTDPRNIRGYHLREHIKDLVYLKSHRGEDGKIYIHGAFFRDDILELNKVVPYREILYVDPEGILRVRLEIISYSNYFNRKTDSSGWLREIKSQWYAKADGIWYEVIFKKIEKPNKADGKYWQPNNWDQIRKESISYYESISIYGKAQRCISKRQLGKKDLKNLKLKNDN
jgi:hypothetical protein